MKKRHITQKKGFEMGSKPPKSIIIMTHRTVQALKKYVYMGCNYGDMHLSLFP